MATLPVAVGLVCESHFHPTYLQPSFPLPEIYGWKTRSGISPTPGRPHLQ